MLPPMRYTVAGLPNKNSERFASMRSRRFIEQNLTRTGLINRLLVVVQLYSSTTTVRVEI
jgi:hypothetical protein